jgi:hypothetical protein
LGCSSERGLLSVEQYSEMSQYLVEKSNEILVKILFKSMGNWKELRIACGILMIE